MANSDNPKVKHSISENFIWNGLLKLFGTVFPLITFPYATRCLGADALGRVTVAAAVISYFSLCANLGIPTYGIRACSQVRDNKLQLSKTVHEIFFINLVTTLLSYIVLLLCIKFNPWFASERVLLLVSSITIIFSCIGMDWLYSAIEEYKYITIRSFFVKVLSLVFLFIFVKDKTDYVAYAGVTSIASVGSNFFNLIRMKKFIYVKPIGNYNFIKHLKPIFTFFATSVAVLIYTNIDTAMLGFLSSNTEVGYYTVAIKLKTVLLSVITSVGVILLPRISYYITNKKFDCATELSSKSLHLILLVSLPLVVFSWLNCHQCIDIIAGPEYYPAEASMMVLMPLLLIVGVANVFVYQFILPRGMEQKYCVITIISAIVDIIINFILIPRFGALGAAIGTLVAEVLGLLLQVCLIKDEVTQIWTHISKRALILSAVLAFIIECIRNLIWHGSGNSLIDIAISGIVFFGSYVLFLWFTKDTLFLEFLKRSRKQCEKIWLNFKKV